MTAVVVTTRALLSFSVRSTRRGFYLCGILSVSRLVNKSFAIFHKLFRC